MKKNFRNLITRFIAGMNQIAVIYSKNDKSQKNIPCCENLAKNNR